MSNFLNKLKQGVTDASKKAQQTVEATTLKFQVSSKEKEIEKSYTDIGRMAYQSMEQQGAFAATPDYLKCREQIVRLEAEISELQRKIQNLQNLKECGCGKMLPADASYCPFCGQQFHTVTVQTTTSSPSSGDRVAFCPRCGETASPGDHFCRGCGGSLRDEPNR